MILSTLHILICIFLTIIVLLQQGRGADMGATFGGGSNTLFGASGADNLLTRVTAVTAVLFMVTSVTLTYRGQNAFVSDGELFQNYAPPKEEIPVKTVPLPSAPVPSAPDAAAPAPVQPPAAAPEEKPAPVDGTSGVQASPAGETQAPASK